jgi:hypothetical protein
MTRWDGSPAGEGSDSKLVGSSCREALLWEDGHLPFATQPGGRPSRAPRVAPNDFSFRIVKASTGGRHRAPRWRLNQNQAEIGTVLIIGGFAVWPIVSLHSKETSLFPRARNPRVCERLGHWWCSSAAMFPRTWKCKQGTFLAVTEGTL